MGKNKDQWIETGISDFLNKLRPYADLQIDYLKEEKILKNADCRQIKEIEGKKILAAIKPGFFLVCLDEIGKKQTSSEFAVFFQNKIDLGQNITFVIGGALGLSDNLKQKADLLLSFSKMTFTHQMVRIFLLEQIYRAFNILQGTGYHK